MDNFTRRQLLQRHKQSGFPGSILDVYKAYDQGIDLLGQFEQKNNIDVAETPQQFKQGLRPAHQAGDINKSMVFPNVPPNTPFNTVGMRAPINIKKINDQGHLIKSYENVPPGVRNLPTGPQRGTVIETPANMQGGGVRRYQGAGQLDTLYVDTPNDPRIQQYADSLGAYNFGQKKYNEAIRHVDSLIANYNSNPSAAVQNDPVSRKVDFAPHDPAGRYANFKYNGLTPYQDVTITPVGSQGPIMLPQSQGFFLEASQPLWAKPKQPVVFRPSPQLLNPIELSQINQSQPIPSLQTGYKSTTRTRPSQTIYKQDPTVSTGQYPIGENMWDPNKKQWFRSMFDKEMQDTFRQNAKPRREKWRTIETPPGGFKNGGVRRYQTGTPPLFGIDSELLKVGVAGTESSGGIKMMNPSSTATGLYGQRFSEIEDSYPGTREEFSTNIAAQDSIFDRRLYQGLNDERSMLNHLQHMYERYPEQIAEKGYTAEQLAGIINMLGREGTRQYLGYVVRDKRDLAEVFPDKYGPDVPEDKKNKTPDEYAQTMQWWMDRYAEENCPGGECMKTTQKRGGKLGIKRYFKLRK